MWKCAPLPFLPLPMRISFWSKFMLQRGHAARRRLEGCVVIFQDCVPLPGLWERLVLGQTGSVSGGRIHWSPPLQDLVPLPGLWERRVLL